MKFEIVHEPDSTKSKVIAKVKLVRCGNLDSIHLKVATNRDEYETILWMHGDGVIGINRVAIKSLGLHLEESLTI